MSFARSSEDTIVIGQGETTEAGLGRCQFCDARISGKSRAIRFCCRCREELRDGRDYWSELLRKCERAAS